MAVKLVEQRVPRGDATRQALMKAAEQLFAEKGPSNVTIREIVEKAGQKNESALQYHFKNMEGLILATHRFRDQQIVDARMAFLEGLERKTDDPSLRDVVEVMVRPTFMLCRESSEFRRYIRAFSLMLASGTPLPWHRSGGVQVNPMIVSLCFCVRCCPSLIQRVLKDV
jgi:AcrR family transcriptional regulator